MNVFHFLECSVRQVRHRRWYLHQFGVRRYLRAEVTNQLKYICLEVIYRSDKIVILLGLFIWRTLQTRLHVVTNCIDQLGITVEFLYFFYDCESLYFACLDRSRSFSVRICIRKACIVCDDRLFYKQMARWKNLCTVKLCRTFKLLQMFEGYSL